MYWLSKEGYECIHARHIGIDIIASKEGKRMGISVKARSRKPNETNFGYTVLKPYNHLQNINKACEDFNCSGYFSFVLDQQGLIRVYLVSVASVLKYYNPSSDTKNQEWKINKFINDSELNTNLNWR
ncbi:hypothetical protein BC351_00850 [Paenibacillus ferrarius]|uniref:PD(D/E)XK endonuclease domain-containing protein n=2 Tax=Paenibacillus ferrarius TaxID=1469647 RepID=A0A1V4HSB3_9BACL|nr:hypothetical protein BC351_00850 [Paenibacillus ferrarius]